MAESLAGRFEVIRSPHWSLTECREAFGFSLNDYLFYGGYPGAAPLIGDESRWAAYVGDAIVEPTLARDVLALGEVRKPALLRSLFMLGATYSAQEISYTKLLGQLQAAGNTATLANYLDMLEQASVMAGLKKFAPTNLASRASSPRLLVFDTALMTYADGATRERFRTIPTDRGHLVETAIGANLLARRASEGFDVFYWRERSEEVDYVLRRGHDVTAIEVKSGGVKATGGVTAFLRQYPEALAIVVGSASCSVEDFLSGKQPLFKH